MADHGGSGHERSVLRDDYLAVLLSTTANGGRRPAGLSQLDGSNLPLLQSLSCSAPLLPDAVPIITAHKLYQERYSDVSRAWRRNRTRSTGSVVTLSGPASVVSARPPTEVLAAQSTTSGSTDRGFQLDGLPSAASADTRGVSGLQASASMPSLHARPSSTTRTRTPIRPLGDSSATPATALAALKPVKASKSQGAASSTLHTRVTLHQVLQNVAEVEAATLSDSEDSSALPELHDKQQHVLRKVSEPLAHFSKENSRRQIKRYDLVDAYRRSFSALDSTEQSPTRRWAGLSKFNSLAAATTRDAGDTAALPGDSAEAERIGVDMPALNSMQMLSLSAGSSPLKRPAARLAKSQSESTLELSPRSRDQFSHVPQVIATLHKKRRPRHLPGPLPAAPGEPYYPNLRTAQDEHQYKLWASGLCDFESDRDDMPRPGRGLGLQAPSAVKVQWMLSMAQADPVVAQRLEQRVSAQRIQRAMQGGQVTDALSRNASTGVIAGYSKESKDARRARLAAQLAEKRAVAKWKATVHKLYQDHACVQTICKLKAAAKAVHTLQAWHEQTAAAGLAESESDSEHLQRSGHELQ